MGSYHRFYNEERESYFRKKWKLMKSDTSEAVRGIREAVRKAVGGPTPQIKNVDLKKFQKPGWNDEETNHLVTLSTHGIFGPMRIVENSKTKETALEKKISKDLATIENFKEEVLCLKLCKGHGSFIQMIAVSQCPNHYSLFLENFYAMSLGSLDGNKMEPWILAAILSETGAALKCLHKKGILHRNITGQSILVNDSLQVKITGFELAKISESSAECVGTMGYIAPEKIAHHYKLIQIITGTTDFEKVAELSATYEKYGSKSDYFSLGVVLFDMFFYRPPAFLNLEVTEQYKEDAILLNMYEGNVKFPEISEDTVPADSFIVFKELMQDLLQKDPVLRPAGKNFKNHRVFNSPQNWRPSTFVHLQHYVKPYTELEKTHDLKVIYNPAKEYKDHVNQSSLEETFLHLSTRPESFPFWQDVLKIFYAQKYGPHKDRWDRSSSSVSTLSRSVSLGFIWTPDEDESITFENFFPTPDPSDNSSPSHDFQEEEIVQTETEAVTSSPPLTNQLPQYESTILTNQDLRSSSSGTFYTSATRCSSSEMYCFCLSPDTAQEESGSVSQPTSPRAPSLEIEEVAADEESTNEEDLVASVILWITFITLCVFYLGKSIYAWVVADKSAEEAATGEGGEGSGHESDAK